MPDLYGINAASSLSEHFLVRVIYADYFDPSGFLRVSIDMFRDDLESHVTP